MSFIYVTNRSKLKRYINSIEAINQAVIAKVKMNLMFMMTPLDNSDHSQSSVLESQVTDLSNLIG
jgi:molybdenum cofactor biosynthesis enzyme MoaA